MTSTKTPRGIRNNNPLNIRIGCAWIGEVPVNHDGVFEQFVTMHYGLRAAFVLLRRYIEHYHLDTPRLIIQRWAPRAENDTDAYIASVERLSGVPADTHLEFADRDRLCAVVSAMAYVESRTILPSYDILEGYRLSLA